jgi:hypothetical protein
MEYDTSFPPVVQIFVIWGTKVMVLDVAATAPRIVATALGIHKRLWALISGTAPMPSNDLFTLL